MIKRETGKGGGREGEKKVHVTVSPSVRTIKNSIIEHTMMSHRGYRRAIIETNIMATGGDASLLPPRYWRRCIPSPSLPCTQVGPAMHTGWQAGWGAHTLPLWPLRLPVFSKENVEKSWTRLVLAAANRWPP